LGIDPPLNPVYLDPMANENYLMKDLSEAAGLISDLVAEARADVTREAEYGGSSYDAALAYLGRVVAVQTAIESAIRFAPVMEAA